MKMKLDGRFLSVAVILAISSVASFTILSVAGLNCDDGNRGYEPESELYINQNYNIETKYNGHSHTEKINSEEKTKGETEAKTKLVNWDSPTSAKTYMDYRKITNESSKQWEIIHSELMVCADGMLRDKYGRIAVALGSYFGDVGSTWRFYLDDNGVIKSIDVIKTDAKADIDTEKNNIVGIPAGDVIEFVIDSNAFQIWENGYAVGGNFNNIEEYRGDVIGWEVIE